MTRQMIPKKPQGNGPAVFSEITELEIDVDIQRFLFLLFC